MIPKIDDLKYLCLNNDARTRVLFRRSRGLRSASIHKPYCASELDTMFGPYLRELDTTNLSPREVRLIETILYAWAYGNILGIDL